MLTRKVWILLGLVLLWGRTAPAADNPGEWVVLFNGTDLSGWKVRHDKYTITKFVDADNKEIKGARKAKVDQKETVVDAKGKAIDGAKVSKVGGKEVPA